MASGSMAIGLIRFLYLLRRGRKFKLVDIVLEPLLAILGGMLVWAVNEAADTPDILQAVLTSLGAWGGPRTVHFFEQKYFGGSRDTDRMPLNKE